MIPHFHADELLELQQILSTPKNIVITTHHKPDGDALGSSLGLLNYLQKKGHNVTMVSPSEFHRDFRRNTRLLIEPAAAAAGR